MYVLSAPGCGQEHTCAWMYKYKEYKFWKTRTEYICWYFYNDYIEFIIIAGK